MSAKAQSQLPRTTTIPTYEVVYAEIVKRSVQQVTGAQHCLRYYQPGGYFGVSIDTAMFSSNFWKALLEIDAYLVNHSTTRRMFTLGEFIHTEYDIVAESEEWIDESPTLDEFMDNLQSMIYENDTLWVEKVDEEGDEEGDLCSAT